MKAYSFKWIHIWSFTGHFVYHGDATADSTTWIALCGCREAFEPSLFQFHKEETALVSVELPEVQFSGNFRFLKTSLGMPEGSSQSNTLEDSIEGVMQNVVANLLKEITAAIRSATFDETVLGKIEELSANNLGASYHFFDKFAEIQSADITDLQVSVLIQYLHRLLPVFGHEKLSPWHHMLLQRQRSQHTGLLSVLNPLCTELIARDHAFRAQFIGTYFSSYKICSTQDPQYSGPIMNCKSRKSEEEYRVDNIVRIIVSLSMTKARLVFLNVNEWFVKPATRQASLDLLVRIIQEQGHRLHEIAETDLLHNLLQLLMSEKDKRLMSVGLMTVTMLLPKILHSMRNIYQDLFSIFLRACSWSLRHPEGVGEVQDSEDVPLQENLSVSVEKITNYLADLKEKGTAYHVGDTSRLEECLSTMTQYKKWILQKMQNASDSPNELSKITEVLNQLSSVSATVQNFIINESDLTKVTKTRVQEFGDSRPPEEWTETLYVLFEHLYSIFPCTFYSHLRSECLSDRGMKACVTPFMMKARLALIFLSSREKELSTDRDWDAIKNNYHMPATFQMPSLHTPPEIFSEDSVENSRKKEETFEELRRENLTQENASIVDKIQKMIEEKVLGPAHELSRSSGSLDKTILASKNTESVRQFLCLKNQLLLEKYLKQEFIRRFYNAHKKLMQSEAKRHNAQSLISRLQDQQSMMHQMKLMFQKEDQDKQLLRSEMMKQSSNITAKLHQLTEENTKYRNEAEMLRMEKSRIEEDLVSTQIRLRESHLKNREYEMKSAGITTGRQQMEELRRLNESLNGQLLASRHQHKKLQELLDREKKNTSTLDYYRDLSEQLSHRLETTQRQHMEVERKMSLPSSPLMTSGPHEEEGNGISGDVLRHQHAVWEDKMKAMEEKYKNLKGIHLGMEVKVYVQENLD
ncbi:putative viral A-type inclusion protein repeat family [Planoprotostelium fungivorum]|uniref:Putative viral A-type inclusion protein repeat family n=1 Tax=Planoprotostelium fungivorum TaxID=1890364 RepID=A0A2P6NZ67_9EUKA|nr:putative viral A-type inclusion protein repeat family [Planoprotostelium fungivorum]